MSCQSASIISCKQATKKSTNHARPQSRRPAGLQVANRAGTPAGKRAYTPACNHPDMQSAKAPSTTDCQQTGEPSFMHDRRRSCLHGSPRFRRLPAISPGNPAYAEHREDACPKVDPPLPSKTLGANLPPLMPMGLRIQWPPLAERGRSKQGVPSPSWPVGGSRYMGLASRQRNVIASNASLKIGGSMARKPMDLNQAKQEMTRHAREVLGSV